MSRTSLFAARNHLFGSTVNVAARLLGLAGPDETIVSDAAIAGASWAARAKSVGERKLRNVALPVQCHLIGADEEDAAMASGSS